MKRLVAALVIAAACSGSGSITAAEATPRAASDCPLPPLSLPLFGGTPVARVVVTPEPIGRPSRSEVSETLTTWVACVNTGDPKLAWAMMSPTWIQRNFQNPTEHYYPAFEEILDGQVVPVVDPLELVAIDAIETGGNAVSVTVTFRSGPDQWTDMLRLVRIHGRLMIDGVVNQTR